MYYRIIKFSVSLDDEREKKYLKKKDCIINVFIKRDSVVEIIRLLVYLV